VAPRTFRLHGLLGSTGWDQAIDHAGSHQQDDELSNINNEKLAQTINGQPMSERLHSWSTWLDILHLSNPSKIIIIHTDTNGYKRI
jgi:hypothetical protein